MRQHTETTPDAHAEIDAAVTSPDASPDATAVPACTLIPQSGCSGATPACDLTAADDGTVACRAVTKQGTANDHCDLETDCKAGYTCVHDHDATKRPWCDRFCSNDSMCTGTGSRCVIGLVGSGGQDLGLDVCSNACDPYGQTGCPTGMACLAFNASAGDYTDCEYTSSPPSYCIVGNDETCDVDFFCESFASPIVIGSVEYGSCQ